VRKGKKDLKAVIQRVKRAEVRLEGKPISSIDRGLLVLVCVEKGDDDRIISWFADKIVSLRIFSDEAGKFNLSVKDVVGEVLIVSNFTVCGTLKKGTRPSFHLVEEPRLAEGLILKLRDLIEERGIRAKLGVFGAHMEVELINDGPVTLVLERSNSANQS